MKYKPRLDGLRCIAIMMVLLAHFLYFLGGGNSGIYGVNLFFVLSGFLITSILLSANSGSFSENYKKFIARRALRIFPIYYLIVLCYILLGVEGIKENWPYLLTYTYNFRVSAVEHRNYLLYSPYWSLSVEEQFYLFFPFIALLLNKRPKLQLTVFIFLIILAISEKIFGFTGIDAYENPLTNMWALTTGAVGAWLVKYNKCNNIIFNSLIVEVLVILSFTWIFWQGGNIIGFMTYPLINIFFVIKASAFRFKIKALDTFLVSKSAIFIGRISYGIYLYHIMVKHFFDAYFFEPLWNKIPFSELGYFSKLQYNVTLIKFPFLVVLTIGVASLSFRFIEMPFLKLKDKYFKNQSKPVLVVSNIQN